MARRPSPAHGCLAVLTAATVLCAASSAAAALPQPQQLQMPQRQMPCCLRVTPFHVQALQQRMFQRFQALEVRAQDLRGVFGAFQAAQGNATRRLRFLESEHARLGEEVARLDSRVQSLEALQRRAANDYRRLQYFPRARRQATHAQLREARPPVDFVRKMRFHTNARDAGETRSGVATVRQSYVDTRSNDKVRSNSNENEKKSGVETFPYVKLGIPSYSNVPATGYTRGDLPRQSYGDARSNDVLGTRSALADKTYVGARSSSNTDYYDKAEQLAPPRSHFVVGMPSHTNVRSNSRRTLAKQSQDIGPAPSSSSSKTNFIHAADEEKRSYSNGATRGSLTEQWYDTASPRRRLARAQTPPPEQLPHLFVHLDDASKDMELSPDASGRMLQVPAHADNEVAPLGRAPEGSYGASPADHTPAAPGRPAPEGSFGASPATDYVPADAASGPAPLGNSGLSSSTGPAATHVNTTDPGHDHAPNIHAATHAAPDHDHALNTLANAPAAAQDHAATPTHDHPSNSSHHHTSNGHDATPGHDHISNTYAANPSYDQASNTHAAPNISTAVPNPNHAANSATTPTPLWKLEAAASEQLDVISAADEDADTESDAGVDAGAGGGGVSFWTPANASDPTLDDLFGGDAIRCSRQPGGDCSDTQSVPDDPRPGSSDGPLPGQTSDAVASASNHGGTVGQVENTASVEDKFLSPGSDNRGESNTLTSEVPPEVKDSKVSEHDTNRSEFLSPGETTAPQVDKFPTTGAAEGAESNNSSRDRSELRPVVNDSKVSEQDPNASEFPSPEEITSSLVDKFLTGVDAGGDCGGGGGGGDCAAQLSDVELREALRELDALLQRPAATAPPPDPEKALLKRALTLALAALERTSDACIGLVDATATAFEGLAARQA